jgi:3-oxoacyl-[acyl-carrier protein] reductase
VRTRLSVSVLSHRGAVSVDLGLEGAVVLITGASGGIGQATARAFAGEGARVALHYYRNRATAEALAEELDGVAFGADLRNESDAEALIPAVCEALGGLDICVANSGVWMGEDVPLWQMPVDRWRSTLEGNLTATFLTSRAYLRHVAQSRHGTLVLVASTAGIFGEAGNADYATAKSAIAFGLCRSLKNEITRVAPLGRVNVVAPGWTVTPMTAGHLSPEAVAHATATMPLRKIATPSDVAAAVVWIASSRVAGHLTGQIITVAGGMEGRLLNDPRDPQR